MISKSFTSDVEPKPCNSLLGLPPHLTDRLANLDGHSVVHKEEVRLLQERALGFESLVLGAELVKTDDTRDEVDLGRDHEILVGSLRVLDEEGDGRSTRVDDGMGKRTVDEEVQSQLEGRTSAPRTQSEETHRRMGL